MKPAIIILPVAVIQSLKTFSPACFASSMLPFADICQTKKAAVRKTAIKINLLRAVNPLKPRFW